MIDWKCLKKNPPKPSPYTILLGRSDENGGVPAAFAGICLDHDMIKIFSLTGMMNAVNLTHWAEFPEPPKEGNKDV